MVVNKDKPSPVMAEITFHDDQGIYKREWQLITPPTEYTMLDYLETMLDYIKSKEVK